PKAAFRVEEGGPPTYWGFPSHALQLQPFQDQRSSGIKQRGTTLQRVGSQADHRSVSLTGPDREPPFRFRNRDGYRDERPIASDLDRVAVAGAEHRSGQGGELTLRDALAAQNHERAGLRL